MSARTLVMVSVVIWLLTVAIIFAYVLPVYYGADPLGLAGKLGIINAAKQGYADTNQAQSPSQTALQSVGQSIAAPDQGIPAADDPLAVRQDTVQLLIPAQQSLDYRLAMERDYDLDYTWTANGKTIYTELRGEAKDGKAPSKTFAKLTSASGKGFFIIPFNGQFGWHWQNKTNQPVTIRLTTKGTYQVVGQVGTPTPK
jgi:hypothetical protein